ncbi:Hypothetical protein I595_2575 [Croceitalea dokdonensis DOKDO 023]|uniref:Uncharacterized protein n=1 Tax=Croceitalea dokdonensis DOKDO 023 TaxID=1300341 RepID=A0A0P7B0A2_9FLAO|nr:hypothetical protein [Croceitalea dokdonensis]KPM31309.1 Hypothetical protein I595_2575 [Croceitalea dokdonensis DOKDO 023]
MVFPKIGPKSIQLNAVPAKDIIIRANRDGDVLFNEKKVFHWGGIFHCLYQKFLDNPQFLFKAKIFLEADKKVSLTTVEKIVNELARFPFKMLYARVGNDKTTFYEVIQLMGTSKNDFAEETIHSGKVTVELFVEGFLIQPQANGLSDYEKLQQLKQGLFGLDTALVKQNIKQLQVSLFRITSTDSSYNGGDGHQSLRSSIKSKNSKKLLLVLFDDTMSFEDYISYLRYFRDCWKHRYESLSIKHRLLYIEIPTFLEFKLRKAGMDFNAFKPS